MATKYNIVASVPHWVTLGLYATFCIGISTNYNHAILYVITKQDHISAVAVAEATQTLRST